MADKTSRMRAHDVDSLRVELDELRSEVKAAVAAAGDVGSEAVESVKSAASKLADRVAEISGEAYDGLAEEGRRQYRSVESRVIENPLAAVAIALAAGLFLGRMLDRRER